MADEDAFWKLAHLSDLQLLASLSGVLRTQRRALAQIVAHLAEVEDRRLHLEAAHSSMFAYCVTQLKMSEDEACRRIELARLARKFPTLFAELASGQITLSVALVLKPVLSLSNHLELLAAARGKCIRQARELVAERFPRADVRSTIRKLPEQRPVRATDPADDSPALPLSALDPPTPAICLPLPFLMAATFATLPSAPDLSASPATPVQPRLSEPLPSLPIPSPPPPSPPAPSFPTPSPSPPSFPASASPAAQLQPHSAAHREISATATSRGVIEPLSAERYRIQFTADRALKEQLERARDLLRHAHPSGDFGPIVSRALDLLIEDLMRRRFGVRKSRKARNPVAATAAHSTSPTSEARAHLAPASATRPTAAGASTTLTTPARTSSSPAPATRPSSIPRAARRAVLERDELSCSWVNEQGERCGSRAWLELDHRHPAGKGGSAEAENLRLLCRSHNRFAAEQAYGRQHIERRSQRR